MPSDSMVADLIAERDALRAELVEALESELISIGSRDGDGWIDTNASGDAKRAGDRLVELGVYERNESRGAGRRQWYRRKETT